MICLQMVAAALMTATNPSISDMKWERRVLLISAPTNENRNLAEQRRIITNWKAGAAARDLTIVEVVDNQVTGASDTVTAIRKEHRLSSAGFTAILIGKDGSEKLRSAAAIPASVLKKAIDAMPMRQAGGS